MMDGVPESGVCPGTETERLTLRVDVAAAAIRAYKLRAPVC